MTILARPPKALRPARRRWLGQAGAAALAQAAPWLVPLAALWPGAVVGPRVARADAPGRAGSGGPRHAIAWGDAPKYGPDFPHFDFVNPQAPRGGSVALNGFGAFDKLNPFTLRGIAAQGLSMVVETLAEPASDEPFTMYGLLARSMEFAPDELSITFRLDPRARFSDGSPVLAADVRHSFETLVGKAAHPRYRQNFADVARVLTPDERTVRFEFRRRNHELHMIIGMQLPVFSRAWGAGKPFDQVVQDPPVGSGPYRVASVDWGKTIVYERRADYWADALPVRRGMFNFQRVTWKYFKDDTARLEGFKAGVTDVVFENSAKNWARGHAGRRYSSGQIVKEEFRHSNSAGMQGFALNTRRPQFADVRVRQALGLAFDFEWMNRMVFFGQYVRSPSYFTNTDMEARGLPTPEEVAVLEPFRAKLSPAVFAEAPVPPVTEPAPDSLRNNLRRAKALLAEAGWTVADDGRLRNARGEAFSFEVLTFSKSFERVAMPWTRNLEKLGIEARIRTTDPTLYKKREDEFDFDAMVQLYVSGPIPGNELVERFASASASEKGADNHAGIRDPVVDALLEKMLACRSREELVPVVRAIDRVLRHGYYLVPHYYSPVHRIAHWARFAHPPKPPLYYAADSWFLKTWWADPSARA